MYMDSSYLARYTKNKLRRIRIFGFKVETLSPNPQCILVIANSLLMYMDSSCLASVAMIKIKTRTYIRFLSGDAIS